MRSQGTITLATLNSFKSLSGLKSVRNFSSDISLEMLTVIEMKPSEKVDRVRLSGITTGYEQAEYGREVGRLVFFLDRCECEIVFNVRQYIS